MDPISALALACNILDVIERGFKCAAVIKEIVDSEAGLRKKHEALLAETESLSAVAEALKVAQLEISQSPVDTRMKEVATKCLSISAAIQAIINKCRPNKGNSYLSAATASIRILLHKSDIEALRAQLESGQAMLNSLVATRTLTDVAKLRKELGHTSRQIEGELRHSKQQSSLILHKLALLDDSLGGVSNSEPVLESLKEVLTSITEVSEAIQCTRILDCLHFPTMNERFRTVSESAPKTFGWIFEEPAKLLEKQAGLEISFPQWLQSGSGIFHIEGKPGAGKSTLMKYLCEHETTFELLHEWAGDKTLVLSQFFFWRHGRLEDQTLGGLIRGLLSGLIQRDLCFAKLLFPKHFLSPAQSTNHHGRSVDLSDKDISMAFDSLTENREALNGYRLCFFIDGLDEFNESKGHSYYSLTQKLVQWASSSAQNIKLCVSSRQMPVFVSAFSPSQRLTVQIFTEEDIKKLVELRLERNPIFKEIREIEEIRCDEVVKKMLQNANGVFLWVNVLLNQLEDALVSRDPIGMLERIVTSAPTELNDFFRHILDAIPSRYARHTFTLLAIMMRLEGNLLSDENRGPRYAAFTKTLQDWVDWHLSLLSCSYLLEALDKGTLRQAVGQPPIDPPSDFKSYQTRIDITSVRIAAQCRGLVERRGEIVQFTHRSIPEFLQQFLASHASRREVDDGDVSAALLWMVLIDLKLRIPTISFEEGEPDVVHGPSSSSRPDSDSTNEAPIYQSRNLDRLWPYEGFSPERTGSDIYKRATDLVFALGQTHLDNLVTIMPLLQNIELAILARRSGKTSLVELLDYYHDSIKSRPGFHNGSVFSSLFNVGLHECIIWDHQSTACSFTKRVDWFLSNFPRIMGLYFFYKDEAGLIRGNICSKSCRIIMDYFLHAGVSVDAEIELQDSLISMSQVHRECKEKYPGPRRHLLVPKSCKMTLWTLFLVVLLGYIDHEDHRIRLGLKTMPSALWKTLEVWLRHGANANITLELYDPPWRALSIERGVYCPDHEMYVTMKDENGGTILCTDGFVSDDGPSLGYQSFAELLLSSGGSITFVEFLRFLRPRNLERLLQLIEQNESAKADTVPVDLGNSRDVQASVAVTALGSANQSRDTDNLATPTNAMNSFLQLPSPSIYWALVGLIVAYGLAQINVLSTITTR